MHNKKTYTRVFMRICARIDIRIYAKYAHMIRVCVVHLYLSCTIPRMKPRFNSHSSINTFWYSNDQKTPNRERLTERVPFPFCTHSPSRSVSVPFLFP